MKPGTLLMLAGGILAAVGYFLPVYVIPSELFVPGSSLYDHLRTILKEAGLISPTYQSEYITGVIVSFLIPVGTLLLIASGPIAFKLRRAGSIMGLSGAVVILTFQLWTFTLNYVFFHTSTNDWNVVRSSQGFGAGFWLAVIGSLLGLIGALLGWLGHPMLEWADEQTPRVAPAALLMVVGGLLASVNIFIPANQFITSRMGLLAAITQPLSYLILWPDLIATVLLLVCGVVALTGRNRALLGGLIGALVGLTFRFDLLYTSSGLALGLFTFQQIPSYWLLVIGCLLGLAGWLLSLMQRPAANARANPLAAPTLP